MSQLLREALDRTLLLMRDELREEVRELELLEALTGTEVVLIGDAANLASPAAQKAFVTTALLMARSGHRVHLEAPDVRLAGHHPLLRQTTLISALMEVGGDLLPGIQFSAGAPRSAVDLCVRYGDSHGSSAARRTIILNANAWSALLESEGGTSRWQEPTWPLGSLAAAALAAGEAFKISMRKLRQFARVPSFFDELFALSNSVRFEVAPADTPLWAKLGSVDFVSAGAIVNAALHCLGSLPDVACEARVIEPEASDFSNLNRYALMLRHHVGSSKAQSLAGLAFAGLRVHPMKCRYEASNLGRIEPLAPRVIVGVDHIPTRWLVQRARPDWLGIGATSHWNAMSSFHDRKPGCAWCLHPRDDDGEAPIPTVAFVSFWSGLLVAAQLVRSLSPAGRSRHDQQIFLTPLRSENVWRAPVSPRNDCPICRESEPRAA